MARAFILVGALLISLGLALYWLPQLLSWFGKLPGDIRIQTDNIRLYLPLTSMALISIIINIAWLVLKKLF